MTFKNGILIIFLFVASLFGENLSPMEKYNHLIEKKPGYASAYFNRGLLYLKEKKWEKAKTDFEHYIKLVSYNPDSFNNLAICCYQLGDYDRALWCWKEALKLVPDSWVYLRNQINVLKNLNRYEEVIEVLESITIPVDRKKEYYLLLAEAFEVLKRPEEAIAFLIEYLQNEGKNDFHTRLKLARFLFDQKKWEMAKNEFEILRTHQQFQEKTLYFLGVIYYEQGQFDKCLDVLQEYHDNYPFDYFIARLSVQAALKLDSVEKALHLLSTAIKKEPLPDLIIWKAQINYQIGNLDSAIADLDQLLFLMPEHIKGRLLKVHILNEKKEYKEVIEELMKISPEQRGIEIYNQLYQTYFLLEDYDNSLFWLDLMLHHNPDDPQWLCQKGICYFKKREWEKALDCFTKAIYSNPLHQESLYNRAHLYYLLGEYEKAIKDLECLGRLNPGAEDVWLKLSIIEHHLKLFQLASIHYNKAKSLNSELPDFEYYFSEYQRNFEDIEFIDKEKRDF